MYNLYYNLFFDILFQNIENYVPIKVKIVKNYFILSKKINIILK